MRLVGAVLAGYAVMFVTVFATYSAAFLGMGAERAFQPGSYEVTPLWIVVSIFLAIDAALIGGFVADRIAPGGKAPRLLALLVFVLGIMTAVPALSAPVDPALVARSGDVGNLEAMMQAKSPTWSLLLTPLIGALGTLAGGYLSAMLRRTSRAR